jgi:molybdopterin converting factor small subunit
MQIRVLLFGAEAVSLGRDHVVVDLPAPAPPATNTCYTLRASLAENFPALRPHLTAARFAVNSEFADDRQQIRETDEIALIGLVGGG